MFVLKDVEMLEVTNNPTVLPRIGMLPSGFIPVKPEEQDVQITTEMVTGRIFINERNEKVCFGMSKEVEKMLGMSFDTIDSLSKNVDIGNDIIKTLRTELLKFKNMSFCKRVKMVFNKPKLSCV